MARTYACNCTVCSTPPPDTTPSFALPDCCDPVIAAQADINRATIAQAQAFIPADDDYVDDRIALISATLDIVATDARRLANIGWTLRHFPRTAELLSSGAFCPRYLHTISELLSAVEDNHLDSVDTAVAAALAPVIPRQRMWSQTTIRNKIQRVLTKYDPLADTIAAAEGKTVETRRRYLDVLADPTTGLTTFTLGVDTAEAGPIRDAIRNAATVGNISHADALVGLIHQATSAQVVVNLYAPLTEAGVLSALGATDTRASHSTKPAFGMARATSHGTDAATVASIPGAIDTHGITLGSTPVSRRHAEMLLGQATHARYLGPERTHSYTPTAAQAAFIRGRDGVCRHPGCTVPAEHCDIDHIHRYNHTDPDQGGPTDTANLHVLCRRHHRLKTAGVFTVTAYADGREVFTSRDDHHGTCVTVPQGPLARATFWETSHRLRAITRHRNANNSTTGGTSYPDDPPPF